MSGSALNRLGYGINSALAAAIQQLVETNYISYSGGTALGILNSDGTLATLYDPTWDSTVVYEAGTEKAQVSILSASLHTLQQTLNQVLITPASDPSILILSTPQDIATTSTVTFGGIVGRVDAGTEAAGNRGQFISTSVAIANQVAVVTGTPKTIASLVIPAGDWDVSGLIVFNGDATTTVAATAAGLSAVTDQLPGAQALTAVTRSATVPIMNNAIPTPVVQISTNVTSTFYLVAFSVFGVAAMNCYGHIQARRA